MHEWVPGCMSRFGLECMSVPTLGDLRYCLLVHYGIIIHLFFQAHTVNMWKMDSDQTRCDNVQRRERRESNHEEIISEDAAVVSTAPISAAALITRPSGAMSLTELARRTPNLEEFRNAYKIVANANIIHTSRHPGPRDMTEWQKQWDNCLLQCKDTCCQMFWDFFLEIHEFPVKVIDTCLHTAKKTFMKGRPSELKLFPTSRRSLLNKIGHVKKFWPKILHHVTIDLTAAGLAKDLPSRTKSLAFKFVDPVWAWMMAAQEQDPLDMHWKPMGQNRANPVYGGGIQYGECFRQACVTCPDGAYPMCVTLHWDGTSGGGISSAPICIGVANTNSSSADTQFCIGYMPVAVDQQRPEFLKRPDATELKFYIRQECCRAILRVLESAAVTGVLCRLRNIKNEEIERLLFPRLVAMNFDQPEAQLFFGNVRKCNYGF